MHPNAQLLQRFYTAFSALDAAAMQACYAPDARFDDEAFSLQGAAQIGAMWRMLCEATKARGMDTWRLEFSGLQADAQSGRAHWEAHYRFGPAGRRVHNVIDGEFRFENGLIVAHRDRFDFWRWARQALGAPGWLLGWSPMLRRKVRATAAANLARFQARG